MPDPIRVLIVEDNPHDAELVLRHLERAGFAPQWHRVETESDYLVRLKEAPDIILADYSLPAFDGLRALDLLREQGLDIPFILVSGRIGEDLAVDAMKRGAYDYLLKDRLTRIGEAVRSALERRRLRQESAWAAEVLVKSEERHRLISEITSDYAYSLSVGPNGTMSCEWITKAFTRITGFTIEEINQRGWQTLSFPADAEIVCHHYHALRSGGASDAVEMRIVGKGGQVRWVRCFERAVLAGPERRLVGIYGAAQDITEQKELEFQFRHSQKMEAIGRLAAGLAHDFNNLLTIVIGCAELLKENFAEDAPDTEHLELILETARRAAQLTRQLLTFSRRQILDPKAVNLNSIVTNLEKMLRRIISEDIQLDVIRPVELGMVRIDPGQLEQVIVNLAVNARDAMPNGGRLTIEMVNAVLVEECVSQQATIPAGEYVTLRVSDTGSGMDETTQARIFEPFFTTKEVGKGTGLGLATAYGIIKQSGGDIVVESALGCGTTLKIYLPRFQVLDDVMPVESVPASMPGHGETILLVEDEAAVMRLIQKTLARRGYTVLAVNEGQEALRICREHPGEIALLLTDVVMPNMSGPELAERVVGLRVGISVLFMSGYAGDALDCQVDAATLIQKPFTTACLERKVREALDARGEVKHQEAVGVQCS